jgi:predicted DNA-binding transcriptional regulator AlpA
MAEHPSFAAPAIDTAQLEQAGLRIMLTEKQILRIVPFSPVTLWRRVRDRTFPKPTFIGPNMKVWYLDEIRAWQAEVNGRGRSHHPPPRGEGQGNKPRKKNAPSAKLTVSHR